MNSDAEIVKELCAIESGLSDWEVAFIEDVTAQVLDDGEWLTVTQHAKALEILDGS